MLFGGESHELESLKKFRLVILPDGSNELLLGSYPMLRPTMQSAARRGNVPAS